MLAIFLLTAALVGNGSAELIGDAGLPATKRLTSTNIAFKTDQALADSGLLGPVRIGCVPK
jgi:hypothetical protein